MPQLVYMGRIHPTAGALTSSLFRKLQSNLVHSGCSREVLQAQVLLVIVSCTTYTGVCVPVFEG